MVGTRPSFSRIVLVGFGIASGAFTLSAIVVSLSTFAILPMRYSIAVTFKDACGDDLTLAHGNTVVPVPGECSRERSHVLWSPGFNPIGVGFKSGGVEHYWICGYEPSGPILTEQFQILVVGSGDSASVTSTVGGQASKNCGRRSVGS